MRRSTLRGQPFPKLDDGGNLGVALDANDRERKADRRLGRHDVFVESTRGDNVSARIPAHGVETLGSRL